MSDLHPVLSQLDEAFEDVVFADSHGQTVAHVPSGEWTDFASAAKEAGFEVCVDVTAVDWMRQRPERFEVVANSDSESKVTISSIRVHWLFTELPNGVGS